MSTPNLYNRIIQVYKSVGSIEKDAEVSTGGSNSYAAVSHDAVTKALHGPIAEAGIVCNPTQLECVVSEFTKTVESYGKTITKTMYRADVKAEIEFINADNPSERMVSRASAYAFDSSDKAVAKAYSMACKMIYLKVFMLESADREEERIEDGYQYSQKPVKNAQKPAAVQSKPKEPPKAPKIENKAPIGQNEQKALFSLAKESNWTSAQLAELIKNTTGKDNTSLLTISEFEYLAEVLRNNKV